MGGGPDPPDPPPASATASTGLSQSFEVGGFILEVDG